MRLVVKERIFNRQTPVEMHILLERIRRIKVMRRLHERNLRILKAFANEVGAGYIKREEHNHAKAGNINHAMTVTDGEFIVIFDCGGIPRVVALLNEVVKERIFNRQTPVEMHILLERIRRMFCGSSAVMRRAALNEVGGIAVETVTEDAHTSLKLNRRMTAEDPQNMVAFHVSLPF